MNASLTPVRMFVFCSPGISLYKSSMDIQGETSVAAAGKLSGGVGSSSSVVLIGREQTSTLPQRSSNNHKNTKSQSSNNWSAYDYSPHSSGGYEVHLPLITMPLLIGLMFFTRPKNCVGFMGT